MYHSIVNAGFVEIGAENRLAHMVPFCRAAERKVADALRASHAECPEGINFGDIGSNHRLAVLKTLPSIVVPHGVVTIEPDSDQRPKNITWVRIPTDQGDILAPINCVRFHNGRDDVYRLTRCKVSDLADFPPTPRLIDLPDEQLLHYLIGVRWTYRAADRSMSFLVRVLAGRLDFERRLFFASAQENIARLDTRLESTTTSVSANAVGPEPELKPRRQQGS